MIPFPPALRRRSSWPSSLVTALIGWNGFATVAALAFGRAALLPALLQAASMCAAIQVLALRAHLRFGGLGGVAGGSVAGGITALALVPLAVARVPALAPHLAVTGAISAYIGAPVGAFLSYFRRDDARIEAAARARGGPIDYGRDAHWLDPFVYGAGTYVIAFASAGAWAGLAAAIVGAMVGVVAAGVSHFFLARFDNARFTIPIAAVAGVPLGAATGWLLRAAPHAPLAGALAGAVCFAFTAAVGRRLAARERAAA